MGRPLGLKPRLLAVASFIRPGDRVADIGTDHARLPVYLIQRGLCLSAVAADISEGPLRRAARTLCTHGLEERIPLRRSNGLEHILPGEVDTVVIAGMGGETMLDIIRAAPWLQEKRLILQPQTLQLSLPGLLAAEGYRLRAETDAAEGRRNYKIYVFEGEE